MLIERLFLQPPAQHFLCASPWTFSSSSFLLRSGSRNAPDPPSKGGGAALELWPFLSPPQQTGMKEERRSEADASGQASSSFSSPLKRG